ncbi:transcriptional regulator [Pseudohongiella nitratireducens]|uniref:Transcriptional regulator n=1 Tax=Pseudohongiella nitratireducens TaxID=1768907 RepID=A0A917LU07_9GAMM|nr:RodZ domain-containing protein [Pseudohongiella nitratireducens]GGG55354.1 transcriptional regulator [Pseudohongiella nitratireducens]
MSNAEEGQTTSDEVTPESPAEQLPTPGALLGAQRETLELSLQQVADRLNLTMHFVRSIESDNYEKLPGDVFIRGYLRSYAELLQLDSEYVLELYNHFTQRRQARKQEAIKRISRRRKDKNRPWVVVSGIAFVLLALILWYFNRPGDPQASQQNDLAGMTNAQVDGAAQEIAALADAESEQSVRIVDGVDLSSRAPSPALPDAANSDAETDQDETPGSTVEDAGPGQGQATVALTEESMSSAGRGRLAPGEQDRVAIEILETQSLNWSGDDVLDIRFSAASQVEVSHNRGSESHEAMATPGLRLLVNGEGPFTLELGNAEAATVIYNERILAFKNAIRDDGSVRLSVGM